MFNAWIGNKKYCQTILKSLIWIWIESIWMIIHNLQVWRRILPLGKLRRGRGSMMNSNPTPNSGVLNVMWRTIGCSRLHVNAFISTCSSIMWPCTRILVSLAANPLCRQHLTNQLLQVKSNHLFLLTLNTPSNPQWILAFHCYLCGWLMLVLRIRITRVIPQ